jgi:hypothetical protein
MGRAKRLFEQATGPLRKLPDFLIIGGARCGTISLIHYLSDHPAVAALPSYQTHYFDRHFDRGPNWYRSWFPLKGGNRAGESTPTYLMDPTVPEPVVGLLPDVKLIALLRDPVERAASHFSLRRGKGAEPEATLAAALDDENRRLLDISRNPGVVGMLDCYFENGSYVKGLRKWLEHFDRSSFLILKSEDLFSNPEPAYDQVLSFLGLGPHRPEFVVHNSTPRLTVEDETLENLRERYRPLNAELEAEFGIRFE